MFERRARVVLAVLILACCALLARAAQVQIVQNDRWQLAAEEALSRTTLVEPARGRLLDRKGRVIAEDVPCNDAAVAFWFVSDPPDPDRLRLLARDLARTTPGYYRATTDEQVRRVDDHLDDAELALTQFWETLAEIGGVSPNELAARRRTIIDRVEARRRDVVLRRHRRAVADHEASELSPWWRKFLLGHADAPPTLADVDEPIAEEEQAHVVLRDVSNERYNQLVKLQSDLPPELSKALRLRASRTRHYPAGSVAAHVVGRIGEVDADDLVNDPELGDELRRYLPGDLAGRAGLERLAERRLRGTRGRLDRDLTSTGPDRQLPAESGEDVTSTVDLELSRDVRRAFDHVDFRWPPRHPQERLADRIETGPMPGAAVVIDVATGGVIAMASAPDFDPNSYADEVESLWLDEVNRPAVNRATLFAAVPGSTVKPIVGLGAITDALIGPHDTIHCDGYLHLEIGGKHQTFRSWFRCWTASIMGQYDFLQRHQTPAADPHPTPGLNAVDPSPGDITLADALQRSCNVYFETLGHRGGIERLSAWLESFGLGEPTGVGLVERGGLVPRDLGEADANEVLRTTLFGSIGQGHVQATPVQMADVAATLARGGVRRPPTLLADELREPVDLGLDPAAIAIMRRGLEAAVATPGGSGHYIHDRLPVPIAGKTGSAQADYLRLIVRDLDGNPVRDADGRVEYRVIREFSTRGNPNPIAPWYRRTNDPAKPNASRSHSWFIGYAPADDPEYAFAAFVEYGGSGGIAAGSVVAQITQALVDHGYLQATRETKAPADDYVGE